MKNGSFSSRFAKRKNWKLNNGLKEALLEITTRGDFVLDVGAGIGRYVELLNYHGRHAYGLDGINEINDISDGLVHEIDFTAKDAYNKANELAAGYHLAVCVEVIEHIPGELMDAFLDNLAEINTSKYLISCAVIGQRGRDHVSCHQPYWVANQLGLRQIKINEPETEQIRSVAGKPWNQKMLVFEKEC